MESIKVHPTKTRNKIKAVGLLSGGLDSTLAAKLMLEQGIEVYAINFNSPFCTCTPKKAGCPAVVTAVKELGGIHLKRVVLGEEYLRIVKNPNHGYGSGMNPCIDCRILKIQKAIEYMHEINASFLFTGEVLNQRPMSQTRGPIDIIDRESNHHGYLLRPLSAMYFKSTIPEQKGWVDREKLLGITGRSRKNQISLAHEKEIRDFPCPAGGCLLTDKHFSEIIRDYFKFEDYPSIKDIHLLKVGRHFRLDKGDKIIVARNEEECRTLKKLCPPKDHLFIPVDFVGPTVLLQGAALKIAVDKMLKYTKHSVKKTDRITHYQGGRTEIVPINQFCMDIHP